MKLPEIKFAKTESLVLRCCRNNLTSLNGFKWKKAGVVKATDWKPLKECGNGLHGWLKGEGQSDVWVMRRDDVWMVLAVKTKDIVDLNGKVKFPSCRVLYVGKREIATALVGQNYPTARVIYGTATAGDGGTANAGYKGTANAGDGGTATAGDYGTANAGYKGIATAGVEGTANAGDYGTANVGAGGTANAGDYGTATAGDYGTATAGVEGTATAGDKGILQIKTWDTEYSRHRIIIGYVGENGLKPGCKYKLDEHAQFVSAQ